MTTLLIAPPPEAEARSDVIHARLLHGYSKLVTELGGDPDTIVRSVGLEPNALTTTQLSYGEVIALLETTAFQLDRPDFGLCLGERQRGRGTFGLLGSVMQHSRTYGEALDYVIAHSYAHSPAVSLWRRSVPEESASLIGHDILVSSTAQRAQVVELILLAGYYAASELTGGRARVRRIHFRHQPLSPASTYRRHFGCEIRFGQSEDAALYTDHDLAIPIIDVDVNAYLAAATRIEHDRSLLKQPLAMTVQAFVLQSVGTSGCTSEEVANRIGIPVRTLHRHLAAQGTSFQEVKDTVRRDLLLYYITRTSLDFAWISERLGLAEQSVMTRMCHRWFGASPRTIRRSGLSADNRGGKFTAVSRQQTRRAGKV